MAAAIARPKLDLAQRPLDDLSGGQRQRAWIAMALAQDTEILLLDEPTTFLDLAHQLEVLELLRDLNGQGRTIVVVLHDLNQASRYADHLVAMRDGGSSPRAPRPTSSTPELVREVFGLEVQILRDPMAGTLLVVPVGSRARAATARRARRPPPPPARRG